MNAKLVTTYFKILSDETRVQIVAMLQQGTMCGCKLLKHLHISQPTLSYHMKMLVNSNLVSAEKQGTWVHYTINQNQMDAIASFFGANNIGVQNECC